MKSRTILITVITFFAITTYGQKEIPAIVKIRKSEFKTGDKKGFYEAWENIKQANLFFLDGPGTYDLARDLYLEAHQYNDENAELNYMIGICYLYTDDRNEALKYLRKAYDKNSQVSPEIHYQLGRAYHLTLQFDKAIEEYNAFLRTAPPDKQSILGTNINKLIQECVDGKAIISDKKRVIISNLGESINSLYDDYFSILSNNDSVMFFTSRRPIDKRLKRNPYDNKFNENGFTSRFLDGKWTDAKPLPGDINTKNNEAIVGISADGSLLFIYKGKEKGGDIFVSTLKEGNWISPDAISSRLLSDEAETSVFLTKSKDTIYFVSANKEITLGGRDILRSVRNSKGKWDKPVNLGSNINSVYDEEGVFISPDGKDLYFSSRGHNTMGGFDIFVSRLQPDGTWGRPENMGYPINTPEDDLFYSLSINGKYGYYSSVREGGFGGKDIFKVTFLGSEKEFQLETTDILIAGTNDLTKKGFFALPGALKVESLYYITGKVLDKKSGLPVTAKLEFIDVAASKVIATGITGDSGIYKVALEAPKQYGVEIIARDYMFFLDTVKMTNAVPDIPYKRDFLLEKIEVGTKVVLENIYFETGKAILTEASYPMLNQVVDFMKSNESLKMEISGHTDNVGSLSFNTKLSENRARAVVDYLVANGIDRARLEARGYGFSQPIAPNNTPAGREKNRRVEFKVISK